MYVLYIYIYIEIGREVVNLNFKLQTSNHETNETDFVRFYSIFLDVYATVVVKKTCKKEDKAKEMPASTFRLRETDCDKDVTPCDEYIFVLP